MRMLAATLVCLVGCASAGRNPGAGDDDDDPVDAPDVDPPADAPDVPVSLTLTQTTNSTNTASNSATCPSGENSWYRVFRLADFGVTSTFNVTQVTFGGQEAAGSPTLTIKIGTYGGALGGTTLDLAQIQNVAMTTLTIPNLTDPGNNQVANVTAAVPAGSNLIVEINNPTNDANKFFFIGASNAGETSPGYVRGPGCSITVPSTTATVGLPQANLNITVTGTHTP